MDKGELLRQCKLLSANVITGTGITEITWDDAMGTLYFVLVIVVVILASVNRNKDKDIETARNSLRIAAGVVVIGIGIYNLVKHFGGMPYMMPTRLMTGGKQLITGIIFIVTASIFLVK